jgi:hypothetical protein|tara:strand:- start:3931 stop:4125 length:195 start_codon:yes stop_codon:yes gene_type:complete
MGVQKNIASLKVNTETLTENLKKVILEEQQTRELAIGTLELLKLMPGYEEALATLQERAKDDGQ